MDDGTKNTVSKLPLLSVRASPRESEAWTARLKEELTALIQVRQVCDKAIKFHFMRAILRPGTEHRQWSDEL